MLINHNEILETVNMLRQEKLDIRTVTLSLNLRDCQDSRPAKLQHNIYSKITNTAKNLIAVVDELESKYGVPIINKRIAVSPISAIAEGCKGKDLRSIAITLDEAADKVGVDFLGGYSALVQKGFTSGDVSLIDSIPDALSVTERVCSSVNVASTKAGINMDAVKKMGGVIKETAEMTRDQDGVGCAKLVVFCNAPEDNPFMAGAYHGIGEAEAAVNIGISGPGVIRSAIENSPGLDFTSLSEIIKKTSFKITRVGELIGREAAKRLGVTMGIIDLSLAPTPTAGDSVALILEKMGLEYCGCHGTTAALALLNEAVKKGGLFATSSTGGLSGSFIPVSEDLGMVKAIKAGALSIDKLEAMTSVCSVGLDMIAVPGDTTAETISAIIADEMSIGMINDKTTATRLIPVPGKKVGEVANFGGLLGGAPIIKLSDHSSKDFIDRGGRIPAPIRSLTN